MKWIECKSCDAEFKIISSVEDHVNFCPYCGDNLDYEDEDTIDFDE